jgi:ABC-type amino acid transport substrate-binding protein
VLTNADVGRYLIGELGLKEVVALEPPLSTKAAFLVLRRTPELENLVERFNWALFEILRDGTYRAIQARYVGGVR